MLLGVILMIIWNAVAPGFFRGETLRESTPDVVLEQS
jgi:hypothetical protein